MEEVAKIKQTDTVDTDQISRIRTALSSYGRPFLIGTLWSCKEYWFADRWR
jgi:hypothetical protein